MLGMRGTLVMCTMLLLFTLTLYLVELVTHILAPLGTVAVTALILLAIISILCVIVQATFAALWFDYHLFVRNDVEQRVQLTSTSFHDEQQEQGSNYQRQGATGITTSTAPHMVSLIEEQKREDDLFESARDCYSGDMKLLLLARMACVCACYGLFSLVIVPIVFMEQACVQYYTKL